VPAGVGVPWRDPQALGRARQPFQQGSQFGEAPALGVAHSASEPFGEGHADPDCTGNATSAVPARASTSSVLRHL
jgi:hypothetical protein